MNTFEEALKFVLLFEGGYSNHPSDPGGATNKGITHTTYKHYLEEKGLRPKNIKNITDGEVAEIYKERYWDIVKAELLPRKWAIALLDWAVNTGPFRAIKHMQLALGVMADGVLGPKTQAAMVLADEAELQTFLQIRENYYKQIAVGKLRVFLKGWLNRLKALREYLGDK